MNSFDKEKSKELSERLRNYVVDDTPENWKRYPGVVTKVEIIEDPDANDFNCKVSFEFKIKKEIKKGKKTYKNILTEGRCEFQELIDDFELMNEDDPEQVYLDLQELCNRYCIVQINSQNKIKALSAYYIDNDNKKAKDIVSYLDENTEQGEIIDPSTIPDIIKYYEMIPMSEPYDKYNAKQTYHACIKSITATETDTHDLNVKVSAYVFNGGNLKVMAQYFNGINSKGKKEFDKFCHALNIVNEDGSISIHEAEMSICSVRLAPNQKGNLYIKKFELLEITDQALEQYCRLLEYWEILDEED